MPTHDRTATRPASDFVPRQVLLFTGHRVDAPGRTVPRFPASLVAAASKRIESELERLHADRTDLAITQGAAGGDLLFAQACAARGMRLQLLLPVPEAAFIAQSLLPSEDGESWRLRYLALRARLRAPPRVADDELGPLPPGADPWERGNLWMLREAMAYGAAKLHLIALWDGEGGDGPGGTGHMVSEAERLGARVHWIDTRSL